MTILWAILILILTLTEETWTATTESSEEMPLTKSLGYLIGDTDLRHNKKYMEMYRDALRTSKESAEIFDEMEEQKLEEVVGRERLQFMKRGILERRRKASFLSSEMGRRRTRSQNKRRDKLNSQGLRSHQRHVRLKDSVDEEQP